MLLLISTALGATLYGVDSNAGAESGDVVVIFSETPPHLN